MGSERSPGNDAPGGASTWQKPATGTAKVRTRVPCLTVCGHAEVTRIGERVLLPGLLVRNPAAFSRVEPHFAHPGAPNGRPLDDPYLSRSRVVLSGDPQRELIVRYDRDDLRVDGVQVHGELSISGERVAHGVVLELAERLVLLLHLVEGVDHPDSPDLPGQSDVIEGVRREIARIAPLDVSVLIRGETGSGKERVAQALHRHSQRAEQALLTVNMATVSTSTAASVLFGHARGAFTGAVSRHAGLFERADRGTLFLDEIAETPHDVQPMLLRVLETGGFSALGETRESQVDVRVIAATDADLERDVREGRFRQALRHRLAGYEIWVPPLRARRDDIPRLLVRFVREELASIDAAALVETKASDLEPFLPSALITRLLGHELPGNVRQLRNLARRLVLARAPGAPLVVDAAAERILELEEPTGQGPRTSAPPAPPPTPLAPRASGRKPGDISDLELLAALEINGWSPRRTAFALGIRTSSVHDLMRRCDSVRKAKDIDDAELREALASASGDLERMAAALRVSERALRLTLRERGLIEE